ncbi:hypothetical protein BKA64DRAFT_647485 [Cadophora sp. MPI-SDFR-AT-0126]|nr:hypothetical protein BKA64DRAFT_647485 [Leotiomycetes sp. MPI-SDFR-AT-0126]
MESSEEPFINKSDIKIFVAESQYPSIQPSPGIDNDHSLKTHSQQGLTSEAQNHGKGEDLFQLASMLPGTQCGDGVQLQHPTDLAGCTGTSIQKRKFSSNSQLPDAQYQDGSQDKLQTSLVFQEYRNTKTSSNSSIPDTRLSNTAPSIKAYFQASKLSAVRDRARGDSLLNGFWPATRPGIDDQLPDTQVPSTQRDERKLILGNQSCLPSTSCISHDDDLQSIELSTFVQDNNSRLDDLPPSQFSDTIPDFIITTCEIPRSACLSKLPLEPADGPNPPALQQSSTLQTSLLLDGHLPDPRSSTDQPSVSINLEASPSLWASQVSTHTSKIPLNKISCRERKRIIISPSRPPNVTKAMIEWVKKTNWLLDPFREDDDCWLHPSPPPALLSVSGIFRPVGKLQKRFTWRNKEGKHSIALNYGIVVKLVNYQMTKQQQDGFVNKQWHLSHLCGNWTCLNPAHTTVEPGHVNISRNSCFSHRSGCLHTPKCMKDKKVALGADGKLVDHSSSAVSGSLAIDEWDSWSSPLLVDENDSIIDYSYDPDSPVADETTVADSSSIDQETDSGTQSHGREPQTISA